MESVRKMTQESILLETDAPYINAHPTIHGSNTPLLLYSIAEKIALIRGTSRDSIIEISNTNAERLF